MKSCGIAGAGLITLLLGTVTNLIGQSLGSETGVANADECRISDFAGRLRGAHPLGTGRRQITTCPNDGTTWDRTTRLNAEESRLWDRAVAALRERGSDECREAASTLTTLQRHGLISVWAAPDTADGMVYYGATYVAPDSTPIAVQFWAPAFRRDFIWIVSALAHEAFHVMRPTATEEATVEFGAACARVKAAGWQEGKTAGGTARR